MLKEGLQELGFDESEIFEIKNRDNTELVDDIGSDQIEQIQAISETDGHSPALLFVLYLGHGVMQGGSVHCADENGDESYDIESFVRICASLPNIFTISIYDCCRR